MKRTLFPTLFSFAAVTFACAPRDQAYWIVKSNDIAQKAIEHLGVSETSIKTLNGNRDLNHIQPGETLAVPYVPSLSPPATWSTSMHTSDSSTFCTAYLQLPPEPTSFSTDIRPQSDLPTLDKESVTGKSGLMTSGFDITSTPASERPGLMKVSSSTTQGDSAAPTQSREHKSTIVPTQSPSVEDTEHRTSFLYSRGKRFCYPPRESLGSESHHKEFFDQAVHEFCRQKRDPLNLANIRYLELFATPTGSAESNPMYILSSTLNTQTFECAITGAKLTQEGCQLTMQKFWTQCDNGGSGGRMEEACVIYDYQAVRPQKHDAE
ncbi:hypothetical protein HIM_11020 [Hirsutella minnesotensis 3608]|uniref:LysM domain-containing protein n=1 Tax=Hirsutella minnesotensis 3608 TaxID=1043627 RepID=A0A0F7ZRG7_9HYPO|nr:hypothetical protein HIM_11020 [Hirsutella minnesotensis 3608]